MAFHPATHPARGLVRTVAASPGCRCAPWAPLAGGRLQQGCGRGKPPDARSERGDGVAVASGGADQSYEQSSANKEQAGSAAVAAAAAGSQVSSWLLHIAIGYRAFAAHLKHNFLRLPVTARYLAEHAALQRVGRRLSRCSRIMAATIVMAGHWARAWPRDGQRTAAAHRLALVKLKPESRFDQQVGHEGGWPGPMGREREASKGQQQHDGHGVLRTAQRQRYLAVDRDLTGCTPQTHHSATCMPTWGSSSWPSSHR